METPRIIQWSPAWAPHVLGSYTERVRDPGTGLCEPQHITMLCGFRHADGKVCGAAWQTTCATGNVRGHINRFAQVHAHKEFAEPPMVVRPGSKRASVLDRR